MGFETCVFAEVEPEPSLQTVRRGAAVASEFQPDWIIGLGGGSPLDASKAIWALYERPDLDPTDINPMETLGLSKAKLIAIPTTSGTGSEVTWALVLTDTEEKRKFSTGSRELVPTAGDRRSLADGGAAATGHRRHWARRADACHRGLHLHLGQRLFRRSLSESRTAGL